MRILFQGDSVTDCGRGRSNPTKLGDGYASFAAQMIKSHFPDTNFEFFNHGISGDRTIDLKRRWETDCIEVNPDILSILIGINDVWRAFDSNDPTTNENYEENYRDILERAKTKTTANLIILEPFVLMTSPDHETWREEMSGKIAITRRLAREYADAYIPLDGLFAAACVGNSPAEFAKDGIHPTELGAQFIAGHYTNAVARLLR